jgi:cytochrome P450
MKPRPAAPNAAPLMTPSHPIPPPAQLPRLQALKVMLDNPIEGWPSAVYEQPIYVPPRRDFPLVYLCEPDAIRTVLVERAASFSKGPLWMRLLKPLLGEGLLTAEGAHWRWQRHAAAPAFQPRQVLQCSNAIGAAAERAVERWRRQATGEARDMAGEFVSITFEVILDTMFGGRDGYDVDAMSAAFGRYVAELGKPTLLDLAGAPRWLKRFTAPGANDAVEYLRAEVDKTIARRRREPPRGDLIDALLNARDPETGRAMTDAELRDNLLTFLAGGHETTALALSWAIFLLSQHPESQHRIYREVVSAAGVGAITAAHAGELQFTKQVIQEAMRLYPPLPALSRVCRQDCVLAGRPTRRGEIVVIPTYALHRHRLYWDNPDCYDPDRFGPGSPLGARRYIYMPFGGGPRVCIGASFAMLEATIILATLVRAAKFEAIEAAPVRPLLRIALRPEHGLPTRVTLRGSEPKLRAA